MEQYRKMDSCPSKKYVILQYLFFFLYLLLIFFMFFFFLKRKSFGANLVRRVRKAGSDLISKVSLNLKGLVCNFELHMTLFLKGSRKKLPFIIIM